MTPEAFFKMLKLLRPLDAEVAYLYTDLRALVVTQSSWSKAAILSETLDVLLSLFPNIAIPTFTYTAQGEFNPDRTLTRLGALNRYVQADPRSFTSSHPMFSYSAIGPRAESMVHSVGTRAFGNESFFDQLDENCVFVHVGRPPELGNTMVHHIEALHEVPYRSEHFFSTRVLRSNAEDARTFSAYMRTIEDVEQNRNSTDFRRAAALLVETGVYRPVFMASRFECLWVARAREVASALSSMLSRDDEIFVQSSDRTREGGKHGRIKEENRTIH